MANQNRNLDGIKTKKTIIRPSVITSYTIPQPSALPRFWQRYWGGLLKKNAYLGLAVFALSAAFVSGMAVALKTQRTEAGATAAPSNPLGHEIILDNVHIVKTSPDVSNDLLFNTPLEFLQEYMASKNTPDILQQRTEKLKKFLTAHNSPLAADAETIATQDHWKLILAISYAESSLGKRCADNNCSGIGVMPGHPLWRKYESLKAWVVDFNRLLEKRYKDKTLEQMCGVYVQPCNPNWLLATKQILTELKEQGIE